jgi:hypothetical protein
MCNNENSNKGEKMIVKMNLKLAGIILGVIFLLLCSQLGFAYTVNNSMRPTGLTITLTLNNSPSNDYFTRYLSFYNMNFNKISVAVEFAPHPTLPDVYVGEESPAGLTLLRSIAEENMRSYWDWMYFENTGDNMALDIAEIEIEIEYLNHAGEWYPHILIGYETDEYLDAGNDAFYVSDQFGRRKYVMDFFDWDLETYFELPDPLRWFVYDLGKTASSDATDSVDPDNPKYSLGPAGAYLCSETVSWYYYEQNIRVTDVWNSPGTVYDFRDIGTAKKMHDQFHYGNLRYDYHSDLNQWFRIDSSGNWDFDNSIIPSPGDYLARMDGSTGDYEHAMMMVKWDPAAPTQMPSGKLKSMPGKQAASMLLGSGGSLKINHGRLARNLLPSPTAATGNMFHYPRS